MSSEEVPEKHGYLDYRFKLKELELKKGWFKDHVKSWRLEPIQDEKSIKIITYWGDKIEPTRHRASGFLIAGVGFLLLVGGIIALFLMKKKSKSNK